MAQERRRLAAVLVADIVGYSRLMGRDESGTLARLKSHRTLRLEPALARNEGRLVKLTGDGALVEFASAVNALKAAIEFQQSVARANQDEPEASRIEFRLGIHLGDVIVDGGDLYGDGVNIAARLEGEAPAGGIVVSRAVRDAVEGRISARFGDLGELALKNIDRPLQAFAVSWDPADWHEPMALVARSHAVAAPVLELPDKPSIAVLPFQNMSGDPEQEYFADGVVEDIISALSRFKSLFVIARNSSFTYKGKSVDIKQVGRELGVRYVLEGSVRKAGNRVRITGQLIEAASGNHLWADRFEGALEDVFDLQDRITTSVVGELDSQLQFAEMERARRKPTSDLTAYDHYLRGMDRMYAWSRETTDEALALFLKAIELDPGQAVAHALAAMCYSLRKQGRWSVDLTRESAEGVRLARRAIDLGRDDPWVLAFAGFALAYLGDELEFGAECLAKSLVLNPNFAFGWHLSGWVQTYLGEPDIALAHFGQAQRLSPRDPAMMQILFGMSFAHLIAGRYEESVRLSEQVIRQNAAFSPAWRQSAVAYAMLDQPAKASAAVARVLALDPDMRLLSHTITTPLRRPEHLQRYRAALRKAGLLASDDEGPAGQPAG